MRCVRGATTWTEDMATGAVTRLDERIRSSSGAWRWRRDLLEKVSSDIIRLMNLIHCLLLD